MWRLITFCNKKKKKKADEQMLWNAEAELGTQRSYGKLMSLQVLDELG